jgi:hypothetical protein
MTNRGLNINDKNPRYAHHPLDRDVRVSLGFPTSSDIQDGAPAGILQFAIGGFAAGHIKNLMALHAAIPDNTLMMTHTSILEMLTFPKQQCVLHK